MREGLPAYKNTKRRAENGIAGATMPKILRRELPPVSTTVGKKKKKRTL